MSIKREGEGGGGGGRTLVLMEDSMEWRSEEVENERKERRGKVRRVFMWSVGREGRKSVSDLVRLVITERELSRIQ